MKHCIFAGIFIFLVSFSHPVHAEPEAASRVVSVDEVRGSLLTAEAAELDLDGLLKLQEAGKVHLLDIRSPERYAAQHVQGAVNIPLTELTETTLQEAFPDKQAPIALMCDFSFFPSRMVAMTIQGYPVLKAAGYDKVYRLNLWQAQDSVLSEEEIEKRLPMVKTPPAPTTTAP